jgi:drug/metabolite transporter (DMT)-like permease
VLERGPDLARLDIPEAGLRRTGLPTSTMMVGMERGGRPDVATLGAFSGVVVFGGLNTIVVRALVADIDPSWGAAARFLVAGVLLLAFVLATRRPMPAGRSLLGAAAYGSIAFAGSYALLYAALQHVHAGTVAVFLALVPLETFGLAIVQGQERFRLRGLVGALIAVAGVAVVMWDQLEANVALGDLLLVLGGTLFIAEGGVVLKGIPKADPYGTNGVAMLSGASILLVLSAIGGEAWTLPTTSTQWLLFAYLVILGSIGLFGLYLLALRRWTASAVSYTTLFMPLVAVPLAAILTGESVSVAFLAGAAIAVAGTYVGAFASGRTRASTATSAPECLPIDDCAPSVAASRAS